MKYRYKNTQKKKTYIGTVILGNAPSPRRSHAASLYKNQTNSMSYMIVYGGVSSSQVMNDVWILNVHNTSNGYAWKQIFKDGGKGSWVQPYGSSNFLGWGGIHMEVHKEPRMADRYGHTLDVVTSSIGTDNTHTISALSYGGVAKNAVSNALSKDMSGGQQGGRNSDFIYLCPEVDMVCAHPIFKGIGTSTKRFTILNMYLSIPFMLYLV